MIPDGQTPHSVTLSVYDELVDVCKPGDRVILTGIYRAAPVRVNSKNRTVKSLYRTYVDVVHVQKSDDKRVGLDKRISAEQGGCGYQEDDRVEAEAEQQGEELRQVAQDPNIYNKLINSIAPGIFGLEDLKKGLLLQLFGGTVKEFVNTQGPKFR
jgi:DNA replication licensing factor MCM4